MIRPSNLRTSLLETSDYAVANSPSFFMNSGYRFAIDQRGTFAGRETSPDLWL